jgi:hypothetical protein
MNEIIENYLKLLNNDLSEYQKTGNFIAVIVLCRLIAFFEMRNELNKRTIIISEADIARMYNAQKSYLQSLSDVYLLNGFDTLYERTMQELVIVNKYRTEYLATCNF